LSKFDQVGVPDALPHMDFWRDLPHLVNDGWTFVTSTILQQRQKYIRISKITSGFPGAIPAVDTAVILFRYYGSNTPWRNDMTGEQEGEKENLTAEDI